MNNSKHQELVGFIWSVADLLRGDYKQSEYGKVILPFTVLRRLDCVLEPTKDAVLDAHDKYKDKSFHHQMLVKASGHSFYNTSPLTFEKIAANPEQAAKHLASYIGGFSANASEVLEQYDFPQQIKKLDEAGLLYQVVGAFADLDIGPDQVSNIQMGYVFEELIRKFSEISNETAGEHFTPREVIRLMVNLLLAPDEDALREPGTIVEVMDPACGTGGMLTETHDHIRAHNPDAKVVAFGQELNAESWAICRSDFMIKGQESGHIAYGNSFSHDKHYGKKFDYMLANPPFGVEWKKVENDVKSEHDSLGYSGRFGAGLPRINDGSFLFLQHMLSKMKPVKVEQDGRRTGGSRLAIVFNGSPLFTGAAESGESRIRRWILENDWLEAIVALPDQMFYNTGISTYFWILTNNKAERHKGKVALIDAREHFVKMRKSLGEKRKEVSPEQIEELTRLYREASTVAEDTEHPLRGKVKVFHNEDFGYRRITVERPLKLRFEMTEEALAALAASKPVQKLTYPEAFREALRPLVGTTWAAKSEAWLACKDAMIAAGLSWPTGTPFNKALREAIGVRDPEGEVQTVKGEVEPDPELRDFENVSLDEDVEEYLKREVLPFVPDAWIDHDKSKIGYEIPFTRCFYIYEPPRPLTDISAEIRALEDRIQELLEEVME